jgi:hypothetical protein
VTHKEGAKVGSTGADNVVVVLTTPELAPDHAEDVSNEDLVATLYAETEVAAHEQVDFAPRGDDALGI